eukprot:TRINITY_DN7546_c0_g1_i2.p1 TRINITY_DN7546_c0_g1~~TRINITY_DN7546_c0_g1_i2.p1  ORF type:complete len:272 (+),score=49.77 TRINITY_DN7546_c0_g1_i2:24-818(+)
MAALAARRPFLSLLPSLLLLLLPGMPTGSTLTWSSCGKDGLPVQIVNVTMEPDPAVSGSDFTFQMPAVSSTDIQGGSVHILVFFHGIPLHTEKDDLCIKTTCPVSPGDFLFTNSQNLPRITPPGVYTVRMEALNSDNKELFCARMTFQIVRPTGTASSSSSTAAAARSATSTSMWGAAITWSKNALHPLNGRRHSSSVGIGSSPSSEEAAMKLLEAAIKSGVWSEGSQAQEEQLMRLFMRGGGGGSVDVDQIQTLSERPHSSSM